MKIISINDMHFRPTAPINRKDDYIEAQFRKLRQVIDYANEIDAPILSAGDLLDKPTIPYWLFNRLVEELKRRKNNFIYIPGNHDSPGHNPDKMNESAIPALISSQAITDWRPGTWSLREGHSLTAVPFGREVPACPANDNYNILMLHEPVYEKTVPFWMTEGLTIKGLEKKYPSYDLYLSGDIHLPAVASKTIVSGSMMRMTIAQKDHKPRFYEIDTISGIVTPHYFDIEEDVWSDVVEIADDDSYKAELRELAETMLARDERLDYPATCRQLAADRPEYSQYIQTLINEYEETKK